MKPSKSHSIVIDPRGKRDSSSEADDSRQDAKPPHDSQAALLDLLHGTLIAQRRPEGIHSVRVQDGVELSWSTGRHSWGEWVPFLVPLGSVVAITALTRNMGAGFTLVFGALSVAAVILLSLLILMSKPKSHRLLVRASDPVVEYILRTCQIEAKGQGVHAFLNELARHPQVETEAGDSLVRRMTAWGRRDA